MKKIINRPADVVREMLEGIVGLDAGLSLLDTENVVVRAGLSAPESRPVALISGGGAGHEPAHAGYVGEGMLTAAVTGEVFTSPSADAVLAAIRAAACPAGALLIAENYTGDRLNFGLAGEIAALEGIPTELVVVADDVALAEMERAVDAIAGGAERELVWLLEHPPLYTAGTSADAADLIQPDRFPVFKTGRGGEYTYHGPGQRVVYVMLDLKRRRQDVRAYVAALEEVIIRTLEAMNVRGERREDRVGVWVRRPERPLLPDGSMAEDKVAALGIRLRRWVSFHGLSINVDPDLDHFGGIVPCGITRYGVTSLVDLGLPVMLSDVDMRLRTAFESVFGPTEIETHCSVTAA